MTTSQYIEGGGPIEADFQGVGTYTSGSSSYLLSANYGTADGRRKIIHAVHVLTSADVTPSIVGTPTIGGINATLLKTTLRAGGGQIGLGIFWLGAAVPTGTSGNLSIAFGANTGVQAGTWSALNLRRFSPLIGEDQATFNSESTASKSLGVDAKKGGLVLAASSLQHDSANPALTAGVGQDYSGLGSGAFRMTGGHSEITADEIGRTITLTRTTGANWQGAFSAISLR